MSATPSPADRPDAWADAVATARILAIDAGGIGGAVLHAGHGPVRDVWLERLRSLLAPDAPVRRVPTQITEERLIGGLDMAATLAQGRPVLQRGVLAECHHGLVLLPMAERLDRCIAARLAATLGSGEVRVERDGFSRREPAVLGVLLLDESTDDDPGIPQVLRERVAIWLDLRAVTLRDAQCPMPDAATVVQARGALAAVRCDDEAVVALCTAAAALGIESLRVPFMALQVARVLAALDGRPEVGSEDLRTAARLVLGPRAVQIPAPHEPATASTREEPPPPAPAPQGDPDAAGPQRDPRDGSTGDAAAAQELAERVLAAAHAAIPADLLTRLPAGDAGMARSGGAGRAGALHAALRRGRPAGVRKGLPRSGIRLSVIETLRAAAPWQRLRRAEGPPARTSRMQLRTEDFHVRRYQQRSETVTVFIVDASGSAAMHRLAEAKGAVELLLTQCYVRRDRVAVIAFRNKSAEVLLPPTRSLLRARRSMAGLAGGGGTPLAAAIHAAARMAESAQRAGLSPTLVFLTDGRGNLTLAGIGDRVVAEREALAAARSLRAAHRRSILIDTSPRPAAAGNALAQAMGGVYLPLPHADSARMAQAVQRVSDAAG
jgi:magnesium chelatase subunit D